MTITFDELRSIKHRLPKGSIRRMAEQLKIKEQTIRNYFGAHDYTYGSPAGRHIQPGPHGGIVMLDDPRILELAQQLIPVR